VGAAIRIGRRLTLILLWTGVSALAWMLGTVILWPVATWRHRWRRAMVRRWARGICRVIGMAVRVTGRPPARPFLLVANHLSYVDIVLLAGELGCGFVSKREVRFWPGLGTLARLVGTVFVDRDRKRDALRALSAIEDRLRRGDGLVLFPEGTSTRGDDVYLMRPALLDHAARTGLPVAYAAVRYDTGDPGRPASTTVCWWGDAPFGAHLVALCGLDGFTGEIHFGDVPIVERDRKRLAQQLQKAIADCFCPIP